MLGSLSRYFNVYLPNRFSDYFEYSRPTGSSRYPFSERVFEWSIDLFGLLSFTNTLGLSRRGSASELTGYSLWST